MEKSRFPLVFLLAFQILCCGIGGVAGKSSYLQRFRTVMKVIGSGCAEGIAVATLRNVCEDWESYHCRYAVDTTWYIYEEYFGGGGGWIVDYVCETIGDIVYPFIKELFLVGARVVYRIGSEIYQIIAEAGRRLLT